MTQPQQLSRPWYREPWPWFLFGLPATAIVAGVITLVFALRSYDGLVTDDYYKEGLGINKRLASEQLAASLALGGELSLTAGQIELRLRGRDGVQLPDRVLLSIISPVRAGDDQQVQLEGRDGLYTGALPVTPSAGHWNLLLEDPASGWRMRGQAVLPATETIVLGAAAR